MLRKATIRRKLNLRKPFNGYSTKVYTLKVYPLYSMYYDQIYEEFVAIRTWSPNKGIYLIKRSSRLNSHGKSSVFVNKGPCMGRGTMGGAEVARGTSCKHGSIQ